MTDKELNVFLKLIRKQKKRVSSNSKSSQKFLKELGVFNKNGKVTKEYKNICILNDQD